MHTPWQAWSSPHVHQVINGRQLVTKRNAQEYALLLMIHMLMEIMMPIPANV